MNRCLSAFLLALLISDFSPKVRADQPVSGKISASEAYANLRDNYLTKFARGLNTPHYMLAVVSQRLNGHTAQLDYAIAANMNRYRLEIKPVQLLPLASGEAQQVNAGEAVAIEENAGRDLQPRHQVVESVAMLKVNQQTNAVEITWTPIIGPARVSNTCIVPLSETPTVFTNGYVEGMPFHWN